MALPFTAPAPADRVRSERSVGRLLGHLGPDGYVVLPDGVVVGPTGVAVVETLGVPAGPSDRARLDKRVLRVRAVTSALDLHLPVRSMLGVVGEESELAERIRRAPVVLGFDEVLRLARDLDAARRRRSTMPTFRRRRR